MSEPTRALPGSAEKMEAIASRLAARRKLFEDDDWLDDDRRGIAPLRCRNGQTMVNGQISSENNLSAHIQTNAFASLLTKIRTEAGMTMTDLSNKAGVSYSAIKYYESGAQLPSVDSLVRIATALNFVVTLTPEYRG